MNLPIRPELAGLEPYGAPQLDVPVRLNVNENPYAPAPEVVAEITQAVAEAATGLNRYPDRDFEQLRFALRDYLVAESKVQVTPEQIWAANGSNEVMLQILQAFAVGQTVMSFDPSYSMYPEYARDAGATWIAGNRDADFKLNLPELRALIKKHHPAVIFLPSPNNPTGTALTLDEVVAACEATRDQGPPGPDGEATSTVVVIDEAYGEFRRAGTPSALELIDTYPHLAVSRTMSKAFGMAGLRLGYLVAATELIDYLRVVRLPYHLSSLTQAAALAALKHSQTLMTQVAQLRAERDQLVLWLREIGLEAVDSDANFVLFGKFSDREAIWQGLLDRGVLIRIVGPEGWLRVSVGTPAETQLFKNALREVLT